MDVESDVTLGTTQRAAMCFEFSTLPRQSGYNCLEKAGSVTGYKAATLHLNRADLVNLCYPRVPLQAALSTSDNCKVPHQQDQQVWKGIAC